MRKVLTLAALALCLILAGCGSSAVEPQSSEQESNGCVDTIMSLIANTEFTSVQSNGVPSNLSAYLPNSAIEKKFAIVSGVELNDGKEHEVKSYSSYRYTASQDSVRVAALNDDGTENDKYVWLEKLDETLCCYIEADLDGSFKTVLIPPAEKESVKNQEILDSIANSSKETLPNLYTVKATAGTYTDCVCVVEDMNKDSTTWCATFYAPGLGMVLTNYFSYDSDKAENSLSLQNTREMLESVSYLDAAQSPNSISDLLKSKNKVQYGSKSGDSVTIKTTHGERLYDMELTAKLNGSTLTSTDAYVQDDIIGFTATDTNGEKIKANIQKAKDSSGSVVLTLETAMNSTPAGTKFELNLEVAHSDS